LDPLIDLFGEDRALRRLMLVEALYEASAMACCLLNVNLSGVPVV
jgi:hypothetical protein